jgi:hypothetical protein
LGERHDIEIEVISKPRAAYASGEYLLCGLPKAPAIMIGDEVIVAGRDISEQELETAIKQHLPQAEHKE